MVDGDERAVHGGTAGEDRESQDASSPTASAARPEPIVRTTDWGFLPIPTRLRLDRGVELDLGMLVIFGLASTATVVRAQTSIDLL